jgi:hypothetical protein
MKKQTFCTIIFSFTFFSFVFAQEIETMGDRILRPEEYPVPAKRVAKKPSTTRPFDGKTYIIKSVSSDLVLDIPCGVQDDLISVFQWGEHGGSNQRWTLKRTEDGYFQIMVNSSNKCLDVLYASKDDMATIVQYTCHGGDHQKWSFRDAGNGSFYITSKASNKVLDVLYWSKIQGTAIVQHTLLNQANQQWRLIQK